MLRVRDLTAWYGERLVLRGLSFDIGAGECVALLGQNGSGKTTLLRVISGVLRHTGGAISLQGTPLQNIKPRLRARLCAVVPQREEIPPGLTAREMALLGRYTWLSWLGVYSRKDYIAADAALTAVGARELSGRAVSGLSGGERQRVLLARAFAQESPLLMLDEPATGLDPAHMTEIFDLLERRRAAGTCVFMAVHDYNLAALYATRLLGLKGGRLLFDGPVEEMMTEANLNALYKAPFCVMPHPKFELPQALTGRANGPWNHAPHHTRKGGNPASFQNTTEFLWQDKE
ncbi:iron ABC transporter ATP-binding protein [Deltaproteobacteria bacterium]|nr:iron ABC transporter ATP-binding protein [Deltaproteobacteria bacterium]